jgi:hypothetical protein
MFSTKVKPNIKKYQCWVILFYIKKESEDKVQVYGPLITFLKNQRMIQFSPKN